MRVHLLEVLAWGSGINSTMMSDTTVELMARMKGRAMKSPACNPQVSAKYMQISVSTEARAQLIRAEKSEPHRLQDKSTDEIAHHYS